MGEPAVGHVVLLPVAHGCGKTAAGSGGPVRDAAPEGGCGISTLRSLRSVRDLEWDLHSQVSQVCARPRVGPPLSGLSGFCETSSGTSTLRFLRDLVEWDLHSQV